MKGAAFTHSGHTYVVVEDDGGDFVRVRQVSPSYGTGEPAESHFQRSIVKSCLDATAE